MKKISVVFLICIIVGILSWYLVKDKEFMMDENTGNGDQVDNFAKGNYTIVKSLVMPPTYHFVVGGIARILKTDDIGFYRLISFILLLSMIPIFYMLSNHNILRTLQFFFCPIMFIFYFLIYTDLFSLLLVLSAFLFLLKKRYYLSSLFGLYAMFVRQDNLIWVLFFCSYIFFNNKYKITNKKHLKEYLIKIIGYIISISMLLSYILYRGKLVLGDTIHHPISFHFGNMWFSLFVFFLLFFPIIFIHLKDIKKYFETRKKYLLSFVVIFLFVFISFTNKHLYNHERGFWFNEFLYLIDNNILFRVFFVISLCISLSYFIIVKYEDISKYLLYPFTVIYLLLSLLIEPRYYFIPFSFFMIFRKEESRKTELFILCYYIIVCIYFLIMLLRTNKF